MPALNAWLLTLATCLGLAICHSATFAVAEDCCWLANSCAAANCIATNPTPHGCPCPPPHKIPPTLSETRQ
ncbi:unnamed protein product [Parajaminaea phylloscopi]